MSGYDIVVTIPKSDLKAIEAEEEEVARRLADGEKDVFYCWRMGRCPKKQPIRRVYFVWDGAVRAYHFVREVDDLSSQRCIWLYPEIYEVEPVSYPSFRGFRYYLPE